jgi:hypothetical protein
VDIADFLGRLDVLGPEPPALEQTPHDILAQFPSGLRRRCIVPVRRGDDAL